MKSKTTAASVYDRVGQDEAIGSFDGVVDSTVGVDDDAAIVYQKGEVQPRGYKDKWFAIAFLSHFLILIGLTATYAPTTFSDVPPLTDNYYGGNRVLHVSRKLKHVFVNTGKTRRILQQDGSQMVPYYVPEESLQELELEQNGSQMAPYYGPEENLEGLEETLESYYDDDTLKEEVGEALDELVEEYYEEEQPVYYGGGGMGVNPSYSNNNGYSTQSGFESDDQPPPTIGQLGAILGIASLTGLIATPLLFSFYMKSTKLAIKISLITNVVYFGLVTLMGFATGDPGLIFKGGLFMFLAVVFGLRVWKRVAFSASLLKASTMAVKANAGVFLYSIGTFVASLLYYLFWAVATVSTIVGLAACGEGEVCDEDATGSDVVIATFFLVLCFYWSIFVFAHTLHVTVAGMVGTYWFTPIEASSCCSKGVKHSFVRASTDSLGSICFASLLIAIIEVLRSMAHNQRGGILRLIAQCLLACVAGIVEIFNRWALVYVGLYGYSFIEAGKNVLSLFESRGWKALVSECMIASVVRMANVTIGIVTGLVSGITFFFLEPETVGFEMAFWIGFLIGAIVSGNVFGVVLSASETVFVCFAEAPNELADNHPELSREMNESFQETWPDKFGNQYDLQLSTASNRIVV